MHGALFGIDKAKGSIDAGSRARGGSCVTKCADAHTNLLPTVTRDEGVSPFLQKQKPLPLATGTAGRKLFKKKNENFGLLSGVYE